MSAFGYIGILLLVCGTAQAQSNVSNKAVKKGNDYYQKGDFDHAAEQYKKALDKDSKNSKAQYNLGNTQLMQKKWAEAAKTYDGVGADADSTLRTNAFYNKGLAYAREKKLPEAIEAFKQSLRYTPEDDNTRENLQKAINELKQQQQQQQNQNQQQPKQQPQNEQKKQQKQQQQPQNNSKLSQQQAEQLLSTLRENEKQLQKQLQKQKGNVTQTTKDW